MQRTRTTCLIVLLTIVTGTSTANADGFHSPGMSAMGAESSRIKKGRKAIVLAQQPTPPSEKEKKPNEGEKDRAATAGETAAEKGKNSSDEKTKSIKPFVPSEEIAAEQAVDFPSDI